MTKLINLTRAKSDPQIIETGPSSVKGVDRLAKSLAWFGIGLGTLELISAKPIARFLGVEGAASETIIRVFGAREIMAGIMTLSTEKKLGLWSRAAGDGLDAIALLAALAASRGRRDNVKLALLAVLGAAALDVYAAREVTARSARGKRVRNFSGRSGFPKGIERPRIGGARGLAERQMAARK